MAHTLRPGLFFPRQTRQPVSVSALKGLETIRDKGRFSGVINTAHILSAVPKAGCGGQSVPRILLREVQSYYLGIAVNMISLVSILKHLRQQHHVLDCVLTQERKRRLAKFTKSFKWKNQYCALSSVIPL